MIAFACAKCKTKLHRPDAEAGTKIFCTSCNQKLLVPTPPRLADKTMLGELQATDNRTLLGELQPAPTSRVQTRPTTQPVSPAASPIRCACPHCNAVINADPRTAGTRASCPSCGCPVEIPLPKANLIEDVSVAQPGVVAAQTPGNADPFVLPDEPSASGYSRGSSYRRPKSSSTWLVVGGSAVVLLLVVYVAISSIGSTSRLPTLPTSDPMPVVRDAMLLAGASKDAADAGERLANACTEEDRAYNRGLRGRQLLPYLDKMIRSGEHALQCERRLASCYTQDAKEKAIVEDAKQQVKKLEKRLAEWRAQYDKLAAE